MTSSQPICSDPDPKDILAAVSELGIGGAAPSLDAAFRGGQCHIYKLSFQDHESVAVRIPLQRDDSSPEDGIFLLGAERQTFQTLEAKGFRWAPKLHGCSLTCANPLKRPFLVLAWVEGSELRWSDDFPSRPLRDKLLGQMASIHMELIKCTVGHGSSSGFFARLAENRQTRVREGKIPDLSEQDCIDQKALLPRALETLECDRIAMEHGDLKPQNIIVDDDFNIKCIIDWGFAAMAPILRAAGLPQILWGQPVPSPAIRADRQSYAAFLASMDSEEARYMKLVQTDRYVDFRTHYLETLFSRGAHALLAAQGWKLPGCEHFENEDERMPSPGDNSPGDDSEKASNIDQ